MEKMVIQLVMSFGGALGFALLFHLNSRHLLTASIGGSFGWAVYLFSMNRSQNLFLSSLLASASTALYAELLARREKAPATLFFIPGIVPLIPGGMLFYTMSAVVQGNVEEARRCSSLTVQYALSIAAGMSLVWAFFSMRRSLLRQQALHRDVRRNRKS
jgi:hypothetical protein